MATTEYSTVKKNSMSSRTKTKTGNSMVSQEDINDRDLMERRMRQVDQFLNGLDEQDLKLLKQRILINQSNSESEVWNAWEREQALRPIWSRDISPVLEERDELQPLAKVEDFPLSLFTGDKGLDKVREALLSVWFNPSQVAKMYMNIINNAVVPTFDWGIIDDYKTKLSALNKAVKLLGYDKKEPVTIRIESLTSPTNFI